MSDLLQTGAAWLATRKRQFASHEVTYIRSGSSLTILAEVGRTSVPQQVDDGGILEFRSRDYLLAAADLVFGGQQVEPQEGDLITEEINEKTCTFQVIPLDGGGCFELVDGFGYRFRVHTKMMETLG